MTPAPAEHGTDRRSLGADRPGGQLEELRQRIGDRTGRLANGEDWVAWLEWAARFPDHSFANTLLIWDQMPSATVLADYDHWQTMGRQVIKGERGIRLMPPLPDHRSQAGPQPGSAASVAVVFDIAQTIGRPIPIPEKLRLSDDDLPVAYMALAQQVRRRGFSIEHFRTREIPPITNWADRSMHLPHTPYEVPSIRALAHELGHLLLHTTTYPDPSTARCRGVLQVEAESVAYLVLARLGINAAGTLQFPDIAVWAGSDPRAPRQQAIHRVADRVLDATRQISAYLDTYLPVPKRPFNPTNTQESTITRAQTNQTAPVAAPPPGTDTQPTEPASLAAPQPPTPDTDLADQLIEIHKHALAFYEARLSASWVPAYLADRGIGELAQRSWRIGYAPAGWTELTEHLRQLTHDDSNDRIFDDTLIEASGLARRTKNGTLVDHFRDRAMVPIRDHSNNVVAFIGRKPEDAPNEIPKYLNSPKTPIYDKGAVLFGLAEQANALAEGAAPVLVEGPFDAIAISIADGLDHERYAGLAPCGTALTAEHITALRGACDLEVAGALVAYDADNAGTKAALRAFDLLQPTTGKLSTVDLPTGQDPADILRHGGPKKLAHALAGRRNPLAWLVAANIQAWDRYDTVSWDRGHAITTNRVHRLEEWSQRATAMRHTAKMIGHLAAGSRAPPSEIGAEITRQVLRIADRLGFDPSEVSREVADAISPWQPPIQESDNVAQSRFHPKRHAGTKPADTTTTTRPSAGITHACRDDFPAGPLASGDRHRHESSAGNSRSQARRGFRRSTAKP